MTDIFARGPYPDHWGEEEIRLWDSEPQTYRGLYDNDREYADLQAAFDTGWVVRTIDDNGYASRRSYSADERNDAREQFYNISGTVPSSFDWDAYRDYLTEVGSPTIAA